MLRFSSAHYDMSKKEILRKIKSILGPFFHVARYFFSSMTKRSIGVLPLFSTSWDWASRKIV